MKYWIGLLFCILTLPASVRAETALEVQSGCRPIAAAEVTPQGIIIPPNGLKCWGAFGAVQDLIALTDATNRRLLQVCAPPNSTRRQLVLIFQKYVEQHPERAHEHFGIMVLDALGEAFPCS